MLLEVFTARYDSNDIPFSLGTALEVRVHVGFELFTLDGIESLAISNMGASSCSRTHPRDLGAGQLRG